MIGKALTAGGLGLATAMAAPVHVEDIPARALQAYVAAAQAAPCAIDWTTLAAVGAVESHHGGELDDEGRTVGIVGSSAGARGPMQFMPGTWAAYGEGDIDDIDDSATAAASLLCANSIEADWTDAIGAYNGGPGWRSYAESRTYVGAVGAAKARYDGVDERLVSVAVPQRAQAPAHNEMVGAPKAAPARDPQRLWDAVTRAWVRMGLLLERVGLGRAWSDADSALFGTSPAPRQVAGVSAPFATRLDAWMAAAPGSITVTSGRRTTDEQMALRARNCPDPIHSLSTECTPWTARPGESAHEQGLAADVAFSDPETEAWAHANAGRYGLVFPMSNEPWHVEPQ